MALRRLKKELNEVAALPDNSLVSIHRDSDDPLHCTAAIRGAARSPLDGGVFMVDIRFSPEHPFRPPKIRMRTPIYHPNTDASGSLDHFSSSGRSFFSCWSPNQTTNKFLEDICHTLHNPNTGVPLNTDAMLLYETDRRAYDAKVREYTARYASSTPPTWVRPHGAQSCTPSETGATHGPSPAVAAATLAGAKAWLAGLGGTAEGVLRRMDLNGDGFISPEELRQAGAPVEIVGPIFAFADSNGDGKVNIAELRALNLVYHDVARLKAELIVED